MDAISVEEPAAAGYGSRVKGFPRVARHDPGPLPDLEGETLQRIRGLIVGALVGVPLGIFVTVTLHATREFAVLIGLAVGLAISVVVATGTNPRDEVADAAWREAAADLPPASDRIALERTQARMPGPIKQRRTGARARDDSEGVRTSNAASQEAESK
jgi:hypothetical protein